MRGAPWTPDSPCFRALGLSFAVSATDTELRDYIERIFRQFRVPGEPEHLYSLLHRVEGSQRSYELYFDDQHLLSTTSLSEAVRDLVRSVNNQAMRASPECVYLHASAVEWGGVAALFPASQDSGKSTLVAGLVRSGLRYITDEAVAIDPDSLTIRPYPKPISLDPGSWPVLPDLRPIADDEYLDLQWQVEPLALREDVIASPCAPALVVFPKYERGVVTELVPLSRPEAVMLLAENSLGIAAHGPRALSVLAAVARRCDAYRLPVSDLDEACEAVRALFARKLGLRTAGAAG